VSERVPEAQAVVAGRGLGELREAGAGRGRAEVEGAGVDDQAADGGAVAADPFCRAVEDDVGAVGDGADEVAAGAEGVVDLFGG